jgi:hypothetical protein
VTTPTTLGGSAGQIGATGSSKKGLFIGLGAAVVAAIAIVVVVTSGGGGANQDEQPISGEVPGTNAATATEPGTAAASDKVGTGTDPGTAPGSDPTPGSAPGSDPGTAPGTNPGSDKIIDPPVKPAAAEVSITVVSNPKGAFVMFGDEDRPRGKTPLTFKVPSSSSDVTIAIELPGHSTEERTVKLTGNVDLEVALKKKSSRDSGSSRGSSGSSGGSRGSSGGSRGSSSGSSGSTGTGDDVMDPFK